MPHLIKKHIASKRHLKYMEDKIQVQMCKANIKKKSGKQDLIEFRIQSNRAEREN